MGNKQLVMWSCAIRFVHSMITANYKKKKEIKDMA